MSPVDVAVVVIGLMGSGKTTVASVLAEALGRQLRDSDPDLQATLGIDAATLAEREGADALHDWEEEHVVKAIRERPPVVVAAAASTIEVPRCREAMAEARVLWLDAPPSVLAKRFESGAHRPRFGQDIASLLEAQDARRRPLLMQVADVVLDATAPVAAVRLQALEALGVPDRSGSVSRRAGRD
jgi:shikimate kinase